VLLVCLSCRVLRAPDLDFVARWVIADSAWSNYTSGAMYECMAVNGGWSSTPERSRDASE